VTQVYDRIGTTYAQTRRPDPRVAALILRGLGDAASVANVGAGTGSYEPADRAVIAVEPSATMIRQRGERASPAVQASAEGLPLADGCVDAALAILTIHHWRDLPRGVAEMRRVARRRVAILTWDQPVWERFWLVDEYLPCIGEIDRRRCVPIDTLTAELGGDARVVPVPIPHDCEDGFFGAFWRRPAAYLDPGVRAGISTFPLMDPEERDEGLRRLAEDIDSGAWDARHSHLLERPELDLGYRLVVAELSHGDGRGVADG